MSRRHSYLYLVCFLGIYGLQQWQTLVQLAIFGYEESFWPHFSSGSDEHHRRNHHCYGNLPSSDIYSDNATRLSINRDTFSWKMIDYDTKPDCGHFKCFFRSSDRNDRERVGYLVAPQQERAGQLRAYEIAQNIDRLLRFTNNNTHVQSRYHFYALMPPWDKKTTPKINEKLMRFRKRRIGGFIGETRLIVQQVDVAPRWEMALLGCSASRIPSSLRALKDILAMADVATLDTMVVEQFEKSIQYVVLPVLEAHPNLIQDFQVLVNRKGELFHLDLDRGRRPPPDNAIRDCKFQLLQYVEILKSGSLQRELTRYPAKDMA